MSRMKDEWDDELQSGRDKISDWEGFRDGIKGFQDWVDRVKRDVNTGDSTNANEVDDDCICEACVMYDAWDLYPTDFELDALDVYEELLDILVKKQEDYGPNNIQSAPGGALNGLQVRLYDKMSRLINLISTGAKPENESLRDTFVDIANYGAIGVMILDGTFPKAKDYNEEIN